MIEDLDIIDGHVHCYRRAQIGKLIADVRYTGARQFCLLVTSRSEGEPRPNQWENAIWLKRRFPEEAFLFGGLDFRGLEGPGTRPELPFERQLQNLIRIGCDGLKLLVGKPDRRKGIGVGLDSAVFEPMLKLAEQTGFPVLWHVGDPPEFWSEQTVPLWARQRGWWYDETVPSKEQIDREIANVFKRHPRLRLILPHFFFLSDRLDDAARLLNEYPSYSLDLAPGVEMYHNLTARHAEAREFFIKFADRIIFGTDFGMPCGWGKDRGMMIRRFLEGTEAFDVPEDPAMTPDARPKLRGLGLPREALAEIYVGNFRRVVGKTPRALLPRTFEGCEETVKHHEAVVDVG